MSLYRYNNQSKLMSNPRKINIKIQGEQKPFETEFTDYDTISTLKNKLYLGHQTISQMVPFVNGKQEVKDGSIRIQQLMWKFPDFVYLMFGSSNPVISAALGAKMAGLTDQTIKSDYLKSFSNSTTAEAVKSMKLGEGLRKVQLSACNKSPTSISSRITDLSHDKLLALFNILKIENGRYMDQKMQIITSDKQSITYDIKEENYEDMIEDKGVSHFFHNQSITEQTKEVYEQGFKDKELKNKIPYLFAFSYEEQKTYARLQKGVQRSNYTFVEHCFPRGEVNLVTVEAKPAESLSSYFQNREISFSTILNFYRKFGQFVIKKFTVGLKRVCSQKIVESMGAKSEEELQSMATMAATRIRQYMLQTSTQLAAGEKKSETKSNSDQQIHYDIKAIGGAIEYCENVTLWKESVNNWELWRIIAVNEVQSTEVYVPQEVQVKIQEVLTERMTKMNASLVKKTPEITLTDKLHESKIKIVIKSNFETISTFKQKILQILLLDKNTLVLIFNEKAMTFDLVKMEKGFVLEFRDATKCFYEREPGYMTACVYNGEVYIATEIGIVRLNFSLKTLKIAVEGNWRESTMLLAYKDKLYANGWRGIYEINPKTGDYFVKIGGDWRFYTATSINNNAYLFYWNVYCLDLDSMIYSKLTSGMWNEFWGDFTYPTSEGTKIWHLYRNTLYCLQGDVYRPVEFVKGGVAIRSFSSRSLCSAAGCLFLANFDHNQHLMRIPL